MAHGFQAMVDMAESPSEIKGDLAMPMPAKADKLPVYPYGLCISLNERNIKKLKIDENELPDVGDIIHFCAMGKVTSVSQSENQSGGGEKSKTCRVEIQITHLAVENEERENRGDDWYNESEKEAA